MRMRLAALWLVLVIGSGQVIASPTSSDFLPCRKMTQFSLDRCLSVVPEPSDECWLQALQDHRSCVSGVMKSYAQPTPEKRAAIQKAAEAARATQQRQSSEVRP